MARAVEILKALGVAYRRDWTAFQSLAGNNFFLFSIFLLGKAGTFVYLIFGLVLLFPLSTDPLRKIPASRLALWPLERREHWFLRLASPWINPLTWGIAVLAIWYAGRTVTVGLVAMIAGLFIAVFSISALPIPRGLGLWRRVPEFPGPLNQLVRKNLREILSTLDLYCALILSAAAVLSRFLVRDLPREAMLAMTVLVVAAMSSYAQCLFGLDGEGGLSRYRLLPVRGWQLLLAKDAAFLAVMIPLTLGLAPLAGLGASLVALAIGHAPAVEHPREQTRWRFSTGGALGNGLVQIVGIAMTASSIFATSILFLPLAAAIWAGSVWWYGRELERQL
ncbi:MAG: hypothetical protein JWP63_179 [Candidatus Solibacter sp.]|jgi:hypothetical protein|nr:hypothetical protein [Candidatus Solibacter sp.]